MIKVEIVKCLKDNFSYIVHNNNEALVVDPSESGPLIKSCLLYTSPSPRDDR